MKGDDPMPEDVRVNVKLQGQERIDDYIARGGSVDEFVIDGRVVKNHYSDNGKSLNDCLRELIQSK